MLNLNDYMKEDENKQNNSYLSLNDYIDDGENKEESTFNHPRAQSRVSNDYSFNQQNNIQENVDKTKTIKNIADNLINNLDDKNNKGIVNDNVRNTAMDYGIKNSQEKDIEKDENDFSLGKLGTTIKGGGHSISAGTASALDLTIDMLTGKDWETPFEGLADYNREQAAIEFQKGAWEEDTDIIKSIKNGNIKEAMSKGVMGAFRNLPQLAMMVGAGIATGGAGTALTAGAQAPLAIISASGAGSKYLELDDKDNLNQSYKATRSVMSGVLEYGAESLGSLNWLRSITSKNPVAKEAAEQSIRELTRNLIDVKDLAKGFGGEFAEEYVTGWSNRMVDSFLKDSGENPLDVIMGALDEQHWNEGIIGGISGLGMSTVAQVSNLRKNIETNKEIKNLDQRMNDLENYMEDSAFDFDEETKSKIKEEALKRTPEKVILELKTAEETAMKSEVINLKSTQDLLSNQYTTNIQTSTPEQDTQSIREQISQREISPQDTQVQPIEADDGMVNLTDYLEEDNIEKTQQTTTSEDVTNVISSGNTVQTEQYGRLNILGDDGALVTVENDKGNSFTIGKQALQDNIIQPEQTQQEENIIGSENDKSLVKEQQDNAEYDVLRFDDGSEIRVQLNENGNYIPSSFQVNATPETQQFMQEHGMIYEDENGELAYNYNNISEYMSDFYDEGTGQEKVQTEQLEPIEPVDRGHTESVVTPDNTEVEVQFEVVDRSQLTPSHDELLRENPAFPKEAQPRNRGKIASEAQIQEIYNKLDPQRLGRNRLAAHGAPIIGPDGAVETGNARVVALNRSYNDNTEQIQNYKQWLINNAEQFGLDSDKVAQIDEPILVKERIDDIDRQTFTEEANKDEKARMSATEQSRIDARRLDEELLAQFEAHQDGKIDHSDNQKFITNFMDKVVGTNAKGEYFDNQKNLNQAGVKRIKGAIFQKAYGSDSLTMDLLEAQDGSNIKRITSAMLDAAPKIVDIQTKIKNNDIPELDISQDLVKAVETYKKARKMDKTVKQLVDTINMPGMDYNENYTELEAKLAKALEINKNSGKRIKNIIQNYNRALENLEGRDDMDSMFGPNEPPTKLETLEAAYRSMARGYDNLDANELFGEQEIDQDQISPAEQTESSEVSDGTNQQEEITREGAEISDKRTENIEEVIDAAILNYDELNENASPKDILDTANTLLNGRGMEEISQSEQKKLGYTNKDIKNILLDNGNLEKYTKPEIANNYTKDDWRQIKGIGKKTAQRIVTYIDNNNINRIEDLKNVKLIGDSTLDNINKHMDSNENIKTDIEKSDTEVESTEEKIMDIIEQNGDIEGSQENEDFNPDKIANEINEIENEMGTDFDLDYFAKEAKRKGISITEAVQKVKNRLKEDVGNGTENPEMDYSTRKQIEDTIRVELGLPLRYGEISKRNVQGLYKTIREVVRLRDYSNLEVTAHEVGHHLSNKFNLRVKSFPNLKKLLEDEGLADSYDESLHYEEGAAEFFKYYLNAPSIASTKAPGFLAYIEETIQKQDPEYYNKIKDLQNLMKKWHEQSPEQRLSGSMTRKKLDTTNILSFKDKLVREFINEDVVLEKALEKAGLDPNNLDVLENPVKLKQLYASVNDRIDTFMTRKSLTPEGTKYGKSLLEILMPVSDDIGMSESKEFGDFEVYYLGKHSLEREIRNIIKRMDNDENLSSEMKKILVENNLITEQELEEMSIKEKMDIIVKEADLDSMEIILKEYESETSQATGLRIDDIIKVVDKLQNEEYDQAIKELNDYQNNLIDHLKHSGMLSKENADNIKSSYNFHVPLYRVFGEDVGFDSTGNNQRFANLPNPIKSAYGSTRIISDPIRSLIKNTNYILKTAEKNKITQSLIENIANEKGTGTLVGEERVIQSTEKIDFSLEQVEEDLIDAGLDPDELENLDLDKIATIYRTEDYIDLQSKDNVIIYRREGEVVAREVHPEIYKTLQGMENITKNDPDGWSKFFSKAIKKPNQIFKQFAVISPTFWIRNLGRDEMRQLVFGKGSFSDKMKIFHSVVDGMGDALGMSKEDIQAMFYGNQGARSGFTEYLREMDNPETVEQLLNSNKTSKNPLDLLARASKFTEDVRRRGFFIETIQNKLGEDVDLNDLSDEQIERVLKEAALEARGGILEDYGIKGRLTRKIDQYAAFTSAGFTGMRHLYNMMKDPKTFAKGIAYITIPSLLLWSVNKDKEEYQEMSNLRKSFFFNLIMDNGTILSFPKPFALGYMFGSIPEAMFNYAYTNDSKEFKGTLYQSLAMGMPNVQPSAYVPYIEALSNYRLGEGYSIVPSNEQGLPAGEQYGEYTSEIAKLLGKMTRISPRKIDHIIRGQFTSVGSNVVDMTNFIAGQQTFKETTQSILGMYSDAFSQSTTINQLYEDREKYQGKITTYKNNMEMNKDRNYTDEEIAEARRKFGYANLLTQRISYYRDKKNYINENYNLPPQTKKLVNKYLDIQAINYARKFYDKNQIDVKEYYSNEEYQRVMQIINSAR